jgi:DNA-binding CsgD family transcriptional regulator
MENDVVKGEATLVITYAIMAIIAAILLLGYIALVRPKEPWLLLLYICVTIVNVGYFLLSVSPTLAFAIFANDLAYLGSVFLSMSMLLTIVKLCGFTAKKKLTITLIVLGGMMFAIIATSGILPWYYKEVSLVHVEGASKLNKVYGVLHPVYMVYLLIYFAAMVACIIQSIRKKMLASQRHATLLAGIVFGNIAVWLVEKFIPWNFEFLSVSYLFSEVILLGLYWMMQDYVRSDLIPRPIQETPRPTPIDIATMPIEEKILKVLSHLKPGEMLAAREREILELVLQNKKRKEIAEELCLSENTIKTYTRTLYGKVGVSSREELYSLLIP